MTPRLEVLPVTGVGEVHTGDDLAALVVAACAAAGCSLAEGDVVVVSSKVVSKALGLRLPARDHGAAIDAQTVRVVAERTSGDRMTRVVQSVAGPVMAAAGVDASNTGAGDDVLLLPSDPDAEARALRGRLAQLTGLARLGVVLSDTAGRPWRAGQTDFALGAAGVAVVDDLRGGVDADGRPLSVTSRALADELAAAADLVKGKNLAVPAAVLRGTGLATADDGPGASVLVRTGAQDWFSLGRAEAVRTALGVPPGSKDAAEVGIPAVEPEPRKARVARAVAVALRPWPAAGVDVGAATLAVSAPTPYELGVAVARLQVALRGEDLEVDVPEECGGTTVVLAVADLRSP
jgi:coenzyme F420-0:L-glutamate ligase / coenzyme F420-1:gamma-L-glutamate ligase